MSVPYTVLPGIFPLRLLLIPARILTFFRVQLPIFSGIKTPVGVLFALRGLGVPGTKHRESIRVSCKQQHDDNNHPSDHDPVLSFYRQNPSSHFRTIRFSSSIFISLPILLQSADAGTVACFFLFNINDETLFTSCYIPNFQPCLLGNFDCRIFSGKSTRGGGSMYHYRYRQRQYVDLRRFSSKWLRWNYLHRRRSLHTGNDSNECQPEPVIMRCSSAYYPK